MRIALVAMPWLSLDRPSLPLGILAVQAARCAEPHTLDLYYANLRWAEFLLQRSDGAITPVEYCAIDNDGIFDGVGDWIFAAALQQTAEWHVAAYAAYLRGRGHDPALAVAMQRLAPAFVEALADELIAGGYDLVGFSSTFMQNVASLALARRLKQRAPRLLTVLGGGNCDGPQGVALHRAFPWLDFVVRGEGEEAFVALLDALSGHGRLEDVPGLCWRRGFEAIANPPAPAPLPMWRVPAPNYDAYFAALEASPVRQYVEPQLVLEAARGCWWGEKHQCTFCGLNGASIAFRSKPPAAVLQELEAAVRRYQALDVIMVDNIMDMRYFATLLPALAASDWDLRLHYEVKSNLTAEQTRLLREAHVWHVQPGIESLSTRVLQLMREGVSGCQNVETLRDCEEQNLTVSWNYLYGFPGEAESDYRPVLDQLPLLRHLQPPEAVTRIALERFSPYFEEPSLGFARRRPAAFYQYIYDLSPAQLAELVYFFESEPQGIAGAVVAELQQAAERWRARYPTSRLCYDVAGESLQITDTRWDEPRSFVIEDPLLVRVLLALRRNHARAGLRRLLERDGWRLSAGALEDALARLRALGLLFEEGGRLVALPVRRRPGQVRLGRQGSAGAW